MGQSLGAKITQKQAVVKLEEGNECARPAPAAITPDKKPDSGAFRKPQLPIQTFPKEEAPKNDSTISSKENSLVDSSTLISNKNALKKEHKFTERENDDLIKKVFESSLNRNKVDDIKAITRNAEAPEKKSSPLLTFKGILDDDEFESLLGNPSPSKSRLPQARNKPPLREAQDSHFGYNPPRFSPEKRFGVLPGITSNAIKPRRDSAGLSKVTQQPFGRNAKLNNNNNAIDRGYGHNYDRRESNRKPGKNDSFWSNLFSDDNKSKPESKPKLSGVTRNEPVPYNPLKYVIILLYTFIVLDLPYFHGKVLMEKLR